MIGLASLLVPMAAHLVAQGAPLREHATYAGILNQAKTSAKVQKIVRELGDYRVEKLDPDEADYYYSFPDQAVEIHFSPGHSVDTVAFLNSEVFNSKVQYAGTLPGGLAFQDQEADVVKKLGAPDEAEDFPEDGERLLYFNERGLTVFLFAGHKEQRKGQIKLIEMYIP